MSSNSAKTANSSLKPAAELARASKVRFPNESAEYRRAREALLAEEIELRRHIERVAEQRRALPPGGEVKKQLRVRGREWPAVLCRPVRRQADAGRLQLHVRPAARAAVSDVHLAAVAHGRAKAVTFEQRVALAVVARSPIERLVAFKHERGWRNLPLYSDVTGEFQPRLSRADRKTAVTTPRSTCSPRRDGRQSGTSGAAR